ncbi:MAG TPA: DUF1848 domain-containing protein [Treponema sp.]|nr:DUF1848 domain-containing protein [Treponema sp.]
MLIFASGRTDIPAFYSEWFMKRIRAGYVDVRNPYFPEQVSRYRLAPDAVDCLVFCTKNPRPMIPFIGELRARGFGVYFFVTITPYGRDIEPGVPDKHQLLSSFRELSDSLGSGCVCWRYDPIFVSSKYSCEYHERAFSAMSDELKGKTERCIISFIDLYKKTLRNFSGVTEVSESQQRLLAERFGKIGAGRGIRIETCAERIDLSAYGIAQGACISRSVIEQACRIKIVRNPGVQRLRSACACLPLSDIGAYNSCPHLCRYCYANYDAALVKKNVARHRPDSSFLLGDAAAGDKTHRARQQSLRDTASEAQPLLGL